MPTINVISNWEVKKLSDDQVLFGTVRSNGVYKFRVTDETGNDSSVVMSIRNIVPVVPEGTEEVVDYTIIPNVVFLNDGFIADAKKLEVYTISVKDITDVERIFIKYVNLPRDERPKSVDEDPFEFNFISPKTNKPFRVLVDRDHFVGIPAVTNRGNVHTNFGYIDHIETDANGNVTRIIMDGIISNRGVFRGGRTVIPYDRLRGIYHYCVVMEPHRTKKAIETSENVTEMDAVSEPDNLVTAD